MTSEFRDTVPAWEATRYEHTQIDDVFLPSVRVQLGWKDVEAAVEQGAILPSEAHTLWAHWASTTSPLRVAAATTVHLPLEESADAEADGGPLTFDGAPMFLRRAQQAPSFSFTNTLYYFGGMVAIGAMTLFMTLGWDALGPWGLMAIAAGYLVACLKVADYLKGRRLWIAAGILATLAVVLVPLLVWCAQHVLGYWPPGGPSSYSAYHTLIDWRWLTLEFATLAAGVVMLWFYRMPFMVMPIAVTLWYLSMDVAHGLMLSGGYGWDWELMRDVSLAFGLATLFIAMWVNVRCSRATTPDWKQDYAFWLYIFGTLMFWGGLSLRDSNSEVGKAVYCLINLVMVFGGAGIGRRVLTVFGGLGVAIYLGDLSHRVFGNSMSFAFVLSLIGLALVGLGVWWQRHETDIQAFFANWLPKGLRSQR